MHIMLGVHLAGVDLNLLVVVNALLEERNVTRAARRLGLSQSAASHALARARALVGDPLLVRGARGTMQATPRARSLEAPVRRALAELSTVLTRAPRFAPASVRRSFRIVASDYEVAVLLPPLLARLRVEAPGIDLWIVPPGEAARDALVDGKVDLVTGPLRGEAGPGLYQRRLYDDRFICLVRAGHPLAGRRMTLARYLAYPHVFIAPRAQPGSYIDEHLEGLGKRRRIAVAVPHLLAVPRILAGSDLVVTLSERAAATFAPEGELVALPTPIPIPANTKGMVWHERDHHDPGHRYLREQLAAVVTPRDSIRR